MSVKDYEKEKILYIIERIPYFSLKFLKIQALKDPPFKFLRFQQEIKRIKINSLLLMQKHSFSLMGGSFSVKEGSLLADSLLADSLLADSLLADSLLADSLLADSHGEAFLLKNPLQDGEDKNGSYLNRFGSNERRMKNDLLKDIHHRIFFLKDSLLKKNEPWIKDPLTRFINKGQLKDKDDFINQLHLKNTHSKNPFHKDSSLLKKSIDSRFPLKNPWGERRNISFNKNEKYGYLLDNKAKRDSYLSPLKELNSLTLLELIALIKDLKRLFLELKDTIKIQEQKIEVKDNSICHQPFGDRFYYSEFEEQLFR